MIRKIALTVAAVAVTLAMLPLSVSAEGNTGSTACAYNTVIVGCTRSIYVVDSLPGNVLTFPAVVGSNTATCAHVGTDQTWCEVSDIPAVSNTPLRVHTCTDGLTAFWVDNTPVCAAPVPLVSPQIGFTG